MKVIVSILWVILVVLAIIGAATLYLIIVTIRDDREMAKKHRINNQSSE